MALSKSLCYQHCSMLNMSKPTQTVFVFSTITPLTNIIIQSPAKTQNSSVDTQPLVVSANTHTYSMVPLVPSVMSERKRYACVCDESPAPLFSHVLSRWPAECVMLVTTLCVSRSAAEGGRDPSTDPPAPQQSSVSATSSPHKHTPQAACGADRTTPTQKRQTRSGLVSETQ